MLFYELPKDKLTYGPNQISAMIDQSTTISEQLTLWDQKGSGVIRGKLVVIPIENSFLYIVPLYLQAEGTNFPQLKRVIAATGDKVVLRATLDDALAGLLGAQETPQINGVSQPGSQVGATQVPATQTGTEVEQERAQLAAAQKAIDSLKLLLNSAPTGLTLVTRNVAVGCAHQLCQIYRTIIGVPLCKLPHSPFPLSAP